MIKLADGLRIQNRGLASAQVTVPKTYLTARGLKPGDWLVPYLADNGDLVLRPAKGRK